ncbi:hypothetical protein SLEP1_g662 [Rubroshorea leprosula]|uniref:Ycf55 n=3 Tax=Rubroshorea leprosula TaxID=152421 RepID=A0AAV5HH45_9ROSI|nr:hypothetical protein SLEP1_g662 [Rubroshorea leprosula]
MAESAVSSQLIKLHVQRKVSIGRRSVIRDSHFRTSYRKCYFESCKVFRLPALEMRKAGSPRFSTLMVSPCARDTSLRSSCLGSLVSSDGVTASDLILVGDQVLLMASIFLTYLAGVVPVQKSRSTFQNNTAQNNAVPESSSSPGRARENGGIANLTHAWDVVREKLLDSLDAIENGSGFESGAFEYNQHHAKQPLSLYAISEGPKIRLLWASFQQLEEEVNNIFCSSQTVDMDWVVAFSEVIQKSYRPVCVAWLEKELCLENKALVSLMIEKLNGDDTVLRSFQKSGKESLYAELLYFLRYGSLRSNCCYDQSLFTLHGNSILEDLVITLADGIASICLELMSVDSNLSDEINSLALTICNLSTRALQRLRNEVALNQWLYQNMEAIVSMYEDRFDLCVLENQVIEAKSSDDAESYRWWKNLMLKRSESTSSSLRKVSISRFSITVKRTKELRALTGWRYYFSLLIEFADITMPIVRAIIDKVSNAISFFLVCLIGRSLGLIYTGIRQSLRWK